VPRRTISSEEGGVWIVSSSVLRTRSRRAAGGAEVLLAGARRAGRLFFLAATRRAGRLFLVGCFPEAAFFARLRPVESLEGVELVRFRFRAFRLAIGFVLSNLDSLPISVVLSVAYRNSGSRLMGPALAGFLEKTPSDQFAGCRRPPPNPAIDRPGGPARHVER